MSSPAAAAYAMPLMPFRQFSQHERPIPSPAAADGPLVVIPSSMAHLSRAKQHANEELAKRQHAVAVAQLQQIGLIENQNGYLRCEIEHLTHLKIQLENNLAKLQSTYAEELKAYSNRITAKIERVYHKSLEEQNFWQAKITNYWASNCARLWDQGYETNNFLPYGEVLGAQLHAPVFFERFKSISTELLANIKELNNFVAATVQQKISQPSAQDRDNAGQLINIPDASHRLVAHTDDSAFQECTQESINNNKALEKRKERMRTELNMLQEKIDALQPMYADAIKEYHTRLKRYLSSVQNFKAGGFCKYLTEICKKEDEKISANQKLPTWDPYFKNHDIHIAQALHMLSDTAKKGAEEIIDLLKAILDPIAVEEGNQEIEVQAQARIDVVAEQNSDAEIGHDLRIKLEQGAFDGKSGEEILAQLQAMIWRRV